MKSELLRINQPLMAGLDDESLFNFSNATISLDYVDTRTGSGNSLMFEVYGGRLLYKSLYKLF